MPDHHQNGVWYESDTMVNVYDETLGIKGLFYCAAVSQEGTRGQGDRTTLLLRLPGLLSASWGEWKSPPVMRSAAEGERAYPAKASSNATTTEVK